jgi:outer membrane receptor protein involved in Fe transport
LLTRRRRHYRFGDDANLTSPVGGYVVVALNAAYRPTDHITAFAVVNNVLNKRYDAYGGNRPFCCAAASAHGGDEKTSDGPSGGDPAGCEALRAASIEVRFDQSELRGGDAWDQRGTSASRGSSRLTGRT